jgi:hypothetical protein
MIGTVARIGHNVLLVGLALITIALWLAVNRRPILTTHTLYAFTGRAL